MPERPSVDASLEAVLREERTRLIAALVRILGDWDVAEELVQDAAVSALEHWPADGIPNNPGAWLMTAARHRAVDRLRRQARYPGPARSARPRGDPDGCSYRDGWTDGDR